MLLVVKLTVNAVQTFLQCFFGDDSDNESQKQNQIEQSCLGGDLIYGVALFFQRDIYQESGYGLMSFGIIIQMLNN